MTKTREKLKNYLENNGIQKNWFVDQLETNGTTFYHILNNKINIPIRFWRKIISKTHNEVTFEDLVRDFVEFEKSDVIKLEVVGGDGKNCLISVSLRELNENK